MKSTSFKLNDFVTVSDRSVSAFKGECGVFKGVEGDTTLVEFTQTVKVHSVYLEEASLQDINNAKAYEEVTIYVAHETNDDRGTLGGVIGFYSSPGNAKMAAAGKGYYGSDGRIRERQALRIKQTGEMFLLDEYHDFPIDIDGNLAEKRKAAVKAALDKLTDTDIELLGLKKEDLL